MKSLSTVGLALVLTIFGLSVLTSCARSMESAKGRMMEKGNEMGKGGAMMEKEKAIMETKSAMMEKEKTAASRTARLTGAENHHAAGTVTITKEKTGSSILTLADIRVDKVPDGQVYFAKGGDYSRGVELGKLKQFSGTVAYPIPTGVRVEDYDSVVIWCKQFSVEIGHAFFEKGMMKTGLSMAEHEKDMMGTDKGMMK